MVNILLLRNSFNEAGLIIVKVKLIFKAVHLIGILGLFLLNPLFEQLIRVYLYPIRQDDTTRQSFQKYFCVLQSSFNADHEKDYSKLCSNCDMESRTESLHTFLKYYGLFTYLITVYISYLD